MGEQWSYRSGPADAVDELGALQRAQDDLWAKLRGEVDPDRRMALLSEFGENRAEIERLTEVLGASGRPVDTAPVSYRVELVGEDAEETVDDPHSERAELVDPTIAPLSFDSDGDLVPSSGLARAHAANLDVDRMYDEQLDDHDPRRSAASSNGHDHRADEHRVDDHRADDHLVDEDEFGGSDPRSDGVETARNEPGRVYDPRDVPESFDSNEAGDSDGPDLGVFRQPAESRQSRRHVPPPPPVRRQRPAKTSQTPVVSKSRPTRSQSGPSPDSSRRILLVLGGLGVVLAMAWFLLARSSDDPPTNVASEIGEGALDDEPAAPIADLQLGELVVGFRNIGLDGVIAERRGDVIFLVGTVPTEADRQAAVDVVATIAPGQAVDASELRIESAADAPPPGGDPNRAASYQTELNRVVASTPIIFDVDQTALSELHSRILNSIGSIMKAYPEFQVTIVGFADGTGSDEGNREVSLLRAQSVEAYLLGLGIADETLNVAARGEETASGSDALANLERRVEFEVVAPAAVEQPVAAADLIRVAIITPSARNDLAFSQSMVDAVDVVAAERGNVEVAVTDSTFVPDDAAAAIRGYADDGYDLVIAHGSQFGSLLLEIAPQYPEVAFAWGTASDTFGLPNVYAYDAAAHQGGYVLGSMSTLLSGSGVVGVIGPIEVGDAELYVNGFAAGARASKPDATVLVNYTGSFSDLTLAAEAAQGHVAGGADVLTGSAQMVVGAVSVAQENGAVWFGTQSNQASLAPSLVAASQVYHWEIILQQIVADIDAGTLGGRNYSADLANGGLAIEYNPDYPLPDNVRQRADEVIAGIVNGSIQVPTG